MKITILKKYDALSDISREVGLVFFASVLIGPIVAKSYSLGMIISGVTLSFVCWGISLALARK